MKFKSFQLRWREPLPNPKSPYLIRWAVIFSGFGVRLHHWLCGDDPRHFHDHPWWMLILVLKGSYTDVTPDGEEVLKAGRFYFRPAEHRHTVRLKDRECWTLLITGRKVRDWGFYVKGRTALMRPLRYFSRYGHHQCED